MIQKISKWLAEKNNTALDHIIDIPTIQKIIKYKFKNTTLLIQAISHRSCYNEADKQLYSNERLEFLGDAVLELAVTEFLFSQFTKENEGELSQKKAVLVSRKVLGQLTLELGLGDFLILNKGEEKTGGRIRISNLANLFEAILGAIYIDGGIVPAKDFVHHFLIDRHNELLKTKTFYNYKSYLLEFAQAKGWGLPKYSVIEESGPDHQKQFIVNVFVNKDFSATGHGSNKKSAEKHAAKNILETLAESYSDLRKIV